MKKSGIAKVSLCVLGIALVCGCATAPKGPTDAEMIQAQVEGFKAALLALDIDKLMATISEDFYHPEVGDKASAKNYLQDAMDSGYLDDGEVDLDAAETAIEDDTATVYPIELSAPVGAVTIGLTLNKETGGWFISEIDVEGL